MRILTFPTRIPGQRESTVVASRPETQRIMILSHAPSISEARNAFRRRRRRRRRRSSFAFNVFTILKKNPLRDRVNFFGQFLQIRACSIDQNHPQIKDPEIGMKRKNDEYMNSKSSKTFNPD